MESQVDITLNAENGKLKIRRALALQDYVQSVIMIEELISVAKHITTLLLLKDDEEATERLKREFGDNTCNGTVDIITKTPSEEVNSVLLQQIDIFAKILGIHDTIKDLN
jgi:hypothetical protein